MKVRLAAVSLIVAGMKRSVEGARRRGRALLLGLQVSLAAAVTAAPSEARAAAPDEAAGRRAVDEFNRGLTMVRGGDLAGLPIAKAALATMKSALGDNHPTTQEASAALLLARFQVRTVKLKLALQNTAPNGPKMTSIWAIRKARELRSEGEEALARGDRAGVAKLEQAYVYMLFGVQDPMQALVAEFSGALSKAYRQVGDEARAEAIEDGDVPATAKVPAILLSHELKALYEQAAAAADRGDWAQAAGKQEALVALLERGLGADAEELEMWWSDLAFYYAAAGRVDEAEVYLARVEKRIVARHGANSPRMREFYGQLAGHFLMRGDAAQANLYREKVWALARKAPKRDATVLSDLLQLADTRVSRRQLAEAKEVVADVEARIKAIGEVSPAIQLRLVVVKVGLLDGEGEHAEATRLLLAAEELANKIDDRSARFLYHRTAAEHARRAGEFPAAGRHFARAGEVGSLSAAVTSGMFEGAALSYWAAGRVEEAIANADKAGETMDALLPTLLLSGTDEEKRKQLLFATLQNHALLSFGADAFPGNAEAAAVGLRTLVRRKAVVLDAVTRSGEVVREQGGMDGQGKLARQAELREALAAVVYHPEPRSFYDEVELQKLTGDIDAVERELGRLAQGAPASKPVTLDELRARLPEGGVLVEFAAYRPTDPRKPGKEQEAALRYAAFVLPKSGPVAAVPLGEAAEIDGRVATLRTALQTPRGKYEAPARGLHDGLIAKLKPHLGDAAHLIIAPSGALSLVPFAALVDGEGKFLVDRYTITYVTSGRELLRVGEGGMAGGPAVLVGAPAYDDPGEGARLPEGQRKALRFGALQGTAEEIAALGKIVPDAVVMTGAAASEQALKAAKPPVLLHVATHGFFLTGDDKAVAGARALEFDPGTDSAAAEPVSGPRHWLTQAGPLLRSGLALAGANARVGRDDGILTALEVASMDLRGTELVVLSACETGVGEVDAGEGVYGLRRALQIAGARSQVMSLWKVDDAATRDLMIAYYNDLAKGTGRGKALREAQRALLADAKRRHPYYWAAFIPSGAWGPMSLAPPRPQASDTSEPREPRKVREYWRHPPKQPIFYFGGRYSAPIAVKPFQDSSVTQRSGFRVDLLFNLAPSWWAGFTYARSMWDIGASALRPDPMESKLGSFEVLLGVDVLGLPRSWRVRPSLNAWAAGGVAWTRERERAGGGADERAIGLTGTFGADAHLHVRFTPRIDMRLGGGVTKSGYLLKDEVIAGQAKFPSAWRWVVGGGLGFIF
jgi:CHAT domain-containing protein